LSDPTATINTMPSKTFFVDMLIRDLSLTDALLDLADNSVDKLVTRLGIDATKAVMSSAGTPPDQATTISLRCNADEFVIEDTSGGMTKKDIEERVFVLGNSKLQSDAPGLSVYGIGMKRAFFKIGNYVELLTKSDSEGELAVTWDIPQWKSDPKNWNLPFSEPDQLNIKRESLTPGTTIRVSQLHPDISEAFNRISFQNDLRDRLETVYAAFLAAGVSIKLGDDPIVSDFPQFGVSEEIKKARHSFKVGDVDVDIHVGVTPWDDRIPRGWYVFCNGRMVVSANKDKLTGWGDEFPIFHPKYNHFLGFVFLESTNLLALPWTTTKQGVIREAHVYQQTLQEMKLQARPVLDFFDNRMVRDQDSEVAAEREMLLDVKPVPLSSSFTLPSFVYTPRPSAAQTHGNISYKKTHEEIRRAKAAYGDPNMSNKSLGEETFDYFLRNEE